MRSLIIEQKQQLIINDGRPEKKPLYITIAQTILRWIFAFLSYTFYKPQRSFSAELSSLPLGNELIATPNEPIVAELQKKCAQIIKTENPPLEIVYFSFSLEEKIEISVGLARHLVEIHNSSAGCHGAIEPNNALFLQENGKFTEIAWTNLQKTNDRNGSAEEDVASFGDCLIILFTSDHYQSIENPTIEDLKEDLKTTPYIYTIIRQMIDADPLQRPSAAQVEQNFRALLQPIER